MEKSELKKIIRDTLEKYFGEVNDLHKVTMDIYEAAEYLKLSPSYIRKLTSQKRIPHRKPYGKKLYFIKSELDEFIFNSKAPDTMDSIQKAATEYINKNIRRLWKGLLRSKQALSLKSVD